MRSIFDFTNRRKQFKEDDILTAHDFMMSEYGWIPLEEFKTLPIPTFFNLINKINKRYEKQKNSMPRKMR